MKQIIKHDVFNIANRIKNIDKNYYIVYDTFKERYEVHHGKQRNGTFCLSLPYASLDACTLDYINKTKVENIKDLLNQIEKNNKEVESAEKLSALHSFNCSIEKLLKRR